ncbi:NUDIX hydrolase [Streptomyces sp. NPDC018045]|uniref:NUDIX hydrolase n=1 Tax=Streptomyces sp. NPDC018045 TaxID=3365037 RepID=UPI0037B474C7
MSRADGGPTRDASAVAAQDAAGHVALLNARFPRHGGDYLFRPGGRREDGESPEECPRRELREEAGVTTRTWRPLDFYAIILSSTARVHLYAARDLTPGPQELTPTVVDFELSWWPMDDALTAAAEGRFLLPSGPLAQMPAERETYGRAAPGGALGSRRSLDE